MTWNVFYAWQSDRPNNTNRGLIQQALDDAITEVREDGTVVSDPRLDKDTLGVPGAPDIESTIFEKIGRAAVFVGDVTLVTPDTSGRLSPNPNVLIELGYALHALGSERVILVMNTAFGRPDELPFDIRRKRVLTYEVPEGAPEKAPERKRLRKVLTEALRLSLDFFERTRVKEPVAPSPAEGLIAALERDAPTRRSATRRYVESAMQEIVRLRPTPPEDDDALVAAINQTAELVGTFAQVAEAFAAHKPEEGVDEMLHLFEELVRHYDPLQGFTGMYNPTDFDFFKFLGHELFVVFTAALLREKAWGTIDQVVRTPLFIANSSKQDRTLPFSRISSPVRLLDETRRDKLRTGNATRVSIRADMLRERYTRGALSKQVSWEEFRAADFFLYLRSRLEPGDERRMSWRPWSAIFLDALPTFITRAESKAHAAQLAIALGLPDVQDLGQKVRQATRDLARFYGAEVGWDPPDMDFDWSKFASR